MRRLIVRKAHPGDGASSAYYQTDGPIPRIVVVKANPNHDPATGRFTSAGGGGGGGGSANERTRDRIEGTQAEADREVAKAGAVVKRIRGKLDAVKARRDALDTPPSIVSQLTAALSSATAKRKALEAEGEKINARLAALKAQLAALKKSLGDDFDQLLTDAMAWRMGCESLESYLSELLTTKAPRLVVFKAGNPNHDPVTGRFTSAGGGGYLHATTRGADGKLTMSDGSPLPSHIAALKIPPKWADVEVNKDPAGGLLAQGKDAKGRVQSVYGESFIAKKAAQKFARNTELMAKESKVVSQINDNLKSSDAKTRENAAAMKVIHSTGIRPGSDNDTGAKVQAYGATTLEGRHVVVNGEKVRLKFTGKKGVALDIPVDDPVAAKILRERKEAAGKKGKIFQTNDGSLREYSHTLGGGSFKPKDFRTLKGTNEALAMVGKMKAPKGESAYKKAVKAVATHVANKLGNTATVALQSYINPVVFSHWREAK
jgi:DNA topoisomerase-1